MSTPAEPGQVAIRIRVRLVPAAQPRDGPRLWVMPGDDAAVADVFRQVSQSALHRFAFARVTSAHVIRLIARADPSARSPVLPPPFAEYTAEPNSALFLPPGYTPSVRLSAARLRRVMGVSPREVAWMELRPTGGFALHRLPASAFRPLDSFVEYIAPVTHPRVDARSLQPAFSLPAFTLEQPPRANPPITLPAKPQSRGGWIARFRDMLFGPAKKPDLARKDKRPAPTSPIRSPRTPPTSGSAPRVAPDWQATRETLPKLFTAGPAIRARSWAALAEQCASPADAAGCWMNAVWESRSPPAAWLSAWVECEQAAGNPARIAAAEVIAAIGADGVASRLRLVEKWERRLPVRMVWLAKLAAGRLLGPDVLAASRCHDRLFARLIDPGPVFGADVPWFVRFADEADVARHEHARLWLLGIRPVVRGWLRSCYRSDHRLRPYTRQSFRATLAAADRLLAKAAVRLGDPDTGRKWATGKKTIPPPPASNADLLVLLGSDEFGRRLRRLLRNGVADDVRHALALAAAEPTAQFLPRAVLAAAERGADERILAFIPRAIDLLPEAVRVIGGDSDAGRVLLIRLLSRTVRSACRLAVTCGRWTAIEPIVRCLIDHLNRGDEVVAQVVTAEAEVLDRTFRKLEAAALSARLFSAVKRPDSALIHFLRGETRSGLSALDKLRDQMTSTDTERSRHRLALEYLSAVRYAPTDAAQRQVSELFRTLGSCCPPTADDDRVWQPALELVDRAVAAAVGDDPFPPAVRAWLDEYAHLTRTRIVRDLGRLLSDAPRS
jgi:hypothetical protein